MAHLDEEVVSFKGKGGVISATTVHVHVVRVDGKLVLVGDQQRFEEGKATNLGTEKDVGCTDHAVDTVVQTWIAKVIDKKAKHVQAEKTTSDLNAFVRAGDFKEPYFIHVQTYKPEKDGSTPAVVHFFFLEPVVTEAVAIVESARALLRR